MLKTTIAKFATVVILVSFAFACGKARESSGIDANNSRYGEPRVIGRITSPEIVESSGLAASRCQTDVLWTHNDSKDGPYIYALGLTGEVLGVWRVEGAEHIDWEDMATAKDDAGDCYLYIGDIGNPARGGRISHKIYRVIEPHVLASRANTSTSSAASTAPAASLEFAYPDGAHDAETLMVHPVTRSIYILTKQREELSAVYKLAPDFDPAARQVAQKLTDFSVPAIPRGSLTGGAISPDGRRSVVCDYAAAYELELPAGETDFDKIWSQPPSAFLLGKRRQGEAITYSAHGNAVYATTENENAPLIEVRRR